MGDFSVLFHIYYIIHAHTHTHMLTHAHTHTHTHTHTLALPVWDLKEGYMTIVIRSWHLYDHMFLKQTMASQEC